jgi:hypothetical protein
MSSRELESSEVLLFAVIAVWMGVRPGHQVGRAGGGHWGRVDREPMEEQQGAILVPAA